MRVLETVSLEKRYARVHALRDFTLALDGGAVGLLGPNGAGKSTLVKILLGLVPPTSGRAEIFGLDVHRFRLHVRQQVGYMPENESYIPGLDAVTYVYLAGRLVGMPHVDAMQRTHVVCNYVGLGEERYRPIETYSTGMKQKVKFAQALVHHPKLLLLDEPTSGLDPRGREEMLALIRDVSHGKGIHVILSSHILHDVEAVCDRVVLMDGGALVRQGTLAELTAGEAAGYEVRIRGDQDAFVRALAARACTSRATVDGALVIEYTNGAVGTDPILRAAVESGAQIRHLSKRRSTLENVFQSILADARNGGFKP